MKEYDIQKALVKILDSKGVLYNCSAGGMRTGIRTAVKMKASGYKRGMPDIAIYEPRGQYHGLFIEVKTLKGTASPHQKQFIKDLQDRGYRAEIVKGLHNCVGLINEYFSVDDNRESMVK